MKILFSLLDGENEQLKILILKALCFFLFFRYCGSGISIPAIWAGVFLLKYYNNTINGRYKYG